MHRFEAIELLNEIANTAPEILQAAAQICLDPGEALNCRIIIKSCLTEDQRLTLLSILENKGIRLIECSSDDWIIQ